MRDSKISKNENKTLRKLDATTIQKLTPLAVLLVLVIVMSFASEHFLTLSNFLNLMRQISVNALIAFGLTFVILTGGIDLSVGSVVALAGALAAGMIASGMNTFTGILLGLLFGFLAGALNGAIVALGNVQPFIATLATMTIYRGLTLLYTNGVPITGLSKSFTFLGQGYFFDVIPVPMVIMLIVFAVSYVMLAKTKYGRYIYAVGGNEKTSFLSGINTKKIKISVYAISGLCAALAGIVLAARLNSAQPTAGQAFETDAIAATVIGGTSMAGGRGWIVGTFIGALVIGIITNGLNLLNVQPYFQQIVKGLIILAAVLLDRAKGK
ncbi:MAG: ribose ABC transporter permease [Bacteroidaceae bacterium]|nr:ribose ABC transporter permease [Bacteroidaceae bacterium]